MSKVEKLPTLEEVVAALGVGQTLQKLSRETFLDVFADAYFGRVSILNWHVVVLSDLRRKFDITEDEVKAHG